MQTTHRYNPRMGITLNISPENERALRAALGGDLDRAALEALVIEGYRAGKLSAAEFGRLVGHKNRWETERWLAQHRVPLNCTLEDLEADRRTLDRVLGKTA